MTRTVVDVGFGCQLLTSMVLYELGMLHKPTCACVFGMDAPALQEVDWYLGYKGMMPRSFWRSWKCTGSCGL